jgi:hypothetical protein
MEPPLRIIGQQSKYKPFSFAGIGPDGELIILGGEQSGNPYLHYCPDCGHRLAKCMKLGDFNGLPNGPLKQALRDNVASLKIRPKGN